MTTQKDGLTSRNRLDRRLGKTSDIRERPVSRRGEVSSLVPKHIVHPTTSYRNYKRDVPPGSPERGDKEGPMDTLQDDEPGNGLRTRGQSTSREWRCSCGRSFSSWKGMRIHQGKSKCSMFGELGQRRGQPYKTLEGSSQELHQSAQSSQVLDTSTRAPTTPSGSLRRKQLKLPSGGESQAWRELDQELSDQLGVILKGSIERKLQKFSEVVYKVCEEKFGLVDYKEKQSQKLG